MPPLLMSGFDRTHLPNRFIREAARGHGDPLSPLVATGRIKPWDLLRMLDCDVPGAAEWADTTLETVLTAAVSQAATALSSECTDCEDIGFYGLPSRENPDMLTALLRRQGDGGYEQLTASGTWAPWEPRWDQHLEILTRDLATDLAEALTAGASGLVRRYFWPKAFLPPTTMVAASPTPELSDPDVAVDGQDSLDPERSAASDGWTEYAVVDDLDPGAVLELIRLRRGPAGPELVAYRNGVWGEAPELLTDLQGVQPPPLVELDEAQLASVLEQIGGGEDEVEGSEDTGDAGEGLDEADKTPAAEKQPPAREKPPVPEDERYLQKDGLAAAGPSTADREKAAKKGQALPEGGFPIKNRADLKKAVKALGRATNKAAAKRHIIKRARALNALSDLPESWGITAAVSLVADAPLTVSPDPRAEKLRRYWTTGKGAAKIRWGTPGDWTRCYRQLRKHMGMRAKGYCQNLHKRSTGIWAGDRSNPGRRAAALAAAGIGPVALSMEAALVAAVSTGRWTAPEGVNGMLKDGIYTEGGSDIALLKTLTAGGFPVAPPDEWFTDPLLAAPTPLTVDDDGRVYGHIATFDVAHIGLPGKVRAPRSRSGYAYFKTGELRTASGKAVNVGQLTLAGGHASLQADAAAAVAHYDNTASAVADVNVGEDRWGIWVAGGLRPEVTPSQLRTLRASAPSGDWRPINGHLELVACCQVNVPGFPTVRARVASGAITSLVAAGAAPLYARRLALMADASVAERVAQLESIVFDSITEAEIPPDALAADGGEGGAEGAPAGDSGTEGAPAAEGSEEGGEKPVSEAVKRARALAAERRKAREADQGTPEDAQPAQEPQAATEEPPPDVDAPPENLAAEAIAEEEKAEQIHQLQVDRSATAAEARMAELRMRVHGNRQPVAASAASD
jgi:hypothetical protein